jgi:DNA-binding transcriptional LysR family regulator
MANGGTLDVARLRVLREVGLRGSIAAAGRSLGLTASAVSQQLAQLEREAGTSLVDRSPRGVALTGAGRALAARAAEVLDILHAARADLDRLTGTLGGPIRVASVASAAVTFVSAAVRDLAAAHADLDVAVTAAEPAAALELLLADDADIAVVDEYDYVPLALPDFVVTRELRSDPLVVTVPADWTGPRRPALLDLADADWVIPPDDAACGVAVRTACRAAGFEPRVRWTSDDMLVLARAVAAGHGVAVLPELSVAADVPGVDVRTLRDPRLERRLTAVVRGAVATRPAITAVLDALADAAARDQSDTRGRRNWPTGRR